MIKSLFRKRPPAPRPRVPADVRVYAIGDIHGCDDAFADLLRRIDADHARRSPKHRIIVLVGDLVDRGPDSAGVIERVLALIDAGQDVRVIGGNHEEMLTLACEGDAKALRLFARYGGRETALSYGVTPERYDQADFDALPALLTAAIPARHRAFLAAMADMVLIGDYALVHAGIRPGVPLAEQVGKDLRWIRNPFLEHTEPHEKFIVHGHTITAEVDERANRLGIDTGAYASGRLTAVALEDDRRWLLQTEPDATTGTAPATS